MSDPPLLEVEDLRLHYASERGVVRAVDGVSLCVGGPGEVVGVIGESGSGKTSLALALLRLLPGNVARFDGAVRLGGEDLMALSDEALRRRVRWRQIAMVFQGAMSALNPVLAVGAQITERLLVDSDVASAEADRQAARLLELVGLPAATARRYPHELSGGMRQRAVIAMALIMRPPLLVLDEPTSALDVSVQAQIMNLLKQLRDELGLSMVFITHDIALASDLADRIAVVHAGELREVGPADTLLRQPQDPYTEALLASVPRLRGAQRPRFLPGAPPDMVAVPTGCRFQPRCPYAFDRCAAPPPLLDTAAGHAARCWLHAEGAPERRLRPAEAAAYGQPAGDADPQPAGRATAEPLLAIDELSVVFQSRRGLFRAEQIRAVTGVSLTLRRGETLAVVGESGSGKTTLGRASLGLVAPSAGSVCFDGSDLARMDARALRAFRRRAQAIFQDPYASISPFMSIGEIVSEPLRVHGPRERSARSELVGDALALAGLNPPRDFVERYPHLLSGGQRQRVSIARAMVLGPDYVVADEPVSMIDASSRAEILSLLRRVQHERGVALLSITHDVASARHFSDRIAVMYAGRVVELGATAAVIAEPAHPYTAALLAAVPEPDPDNRRRLRDVVPGAAPDAARIPSGCPFHTRCPEAIAGTCEVIEPQLAEIAPGRWVSCHLFR